MSKLMNKAQQMLSDNRGFIATTLIVLVYCIGAVFSVKSWIALFSGKIALMFLYCVLGWVCTLIGWNGYSMLKKKGW